MMGQISVKEGIEESLKIGHHHRSVKEQVVQSRVLVNCHFLDF